MQLELKPFNNTLELDKQRALFVECFPETKGLPDETENHYNWKFHSIEQNPHSYEYVAYDENEMIGYYAAIPYQYNYFNQKITAAMVCDVMTGIKARGKGVFVKLGIYSNFKFKKTGLSFSSGFPIRPEVIPGHLKVGWEILFNLPLFARFLKFNSFLKNKKKSFLIPFFNLGASIYGFLINLLANRYNNLNLQYYSSNNDLNKIEGLFEFLNEWQNQIPISLIKDKSFINWRLNAPSKDYNISILRHNRKIIGYAISRYTVKENVPSIGILDLALLEGFHHLSKYLIKDVERFAKEHKAEFIFMMMSSYWFKKYKIWQGGFLRTHYKFKYIFNRLNFNGEDKRPNNVNNWHLMWIDSDDL